MWDDCFPTRLWCRVVGVVWGYDALGFDWFLLGKVLTAVWFDSKFSVFCCLVLVEMSASADLGTGMTMTRIASWKNCLRCCCSRYHCYCLWSDWTVPRSSCWWWRIVAGSSSMATHMSHWMNQTWKRWRAEMWHCSGYLLSGYLLGLSVGLSCCLGFDCRQSQQRRLQLQLQCFHWSLQMDVHLKSREMVRKDQEKAW